MALFLTEARRVPFAPGFSIAARSSVWIEAERSNGKDQTSMRPGDLLKTCGARGGHMKNGDAPTFRRKAMSEAGISTDQQVTAVRVANDPGDEFDAAVESDNPPTVTALSEQGKQSRMPEEDVKRRGA